MEPNSKKPKQASFPQTAFTRRGEETKMNSYTVLEFEQRHNGNLIKLYNGIIKADDLVNRFIIPEYKTGTDTGYQRPAYPSRLSHIAAYILNKEGVMPTSLLANIRNGANYKSLGNGVGVLLVPEGEPLWMVDGQHRTKGLKIAKERKQPLPYDLPIVFSVGLTQEEEMDLFYVVNNTQKSVPTDLTFEIMRHRIGKKADIGAPVQVSELRREASVEIARSLAMDSQSVWFERMQMADEIKQYQKPLRLATFCKTLDSFLSTDAAYNLVLSRDHKTLSTMVDSYWKGIGLLAPAAISDPKHFSIQGPTAAWVFGWVLKDFARIADKADNWSPEFFADKLRVLEEWVDSDTWHKETGIDLTRAKGSGVARLIFEKVHEKYTHPDHTA